MSTTATKEELSGAADGIPVGITATAGGGSGQVIHTANVSITTIHDEVWLWAFNTSALDVKLSIEVGGVTGYPIEQTIPAEGGLALVLPGIILQNAKTVVVFAATTAVIGVIGFVNRVTNG